MLGSTQRVFSCFLSLIRPYGIPRSCRDSEGCTADGSAGTGFPKTCAKVHQDPENPRLQASSLVLHIQTSGHNLSTSRVLSLPQIPCPPTWSQRIVTARTWSWMSNPSRCWWCCSSVGGWMVPSNTCAEQRCSSMVTEMVDHYNHFQGVIAQLVSTELDSQPQSVGSERLQTVWMVHGLVCPEMILKI